MPRHDQEYRALERIRVEFSLDSAGDGNVVGRAIGHYPIESCQRSRHRTGPLRIQYAQVDDAGIGREQNSNPLVRLYLNGSLDPAHGQLDAARKSSPGCLRSERKAGRAHFKPRRLSIA